MQSALKIFRPEHFHIPTLLSDDPRIEPFDEKVYAVIHWLYRMKDGRCIASNMTLAIMVKPSDPQPRSVQNALNRLEECGFITRSYKDQSRRHRKEIIPLIAYQVEKIERNGDDTKNQSETAMTPERNHDDTQSETAMTRTRIINKNSKLEDSASQKKHENSVDYLSDIPNKDLQEWTTRFVVTESEIKSKAEDLLLYCERKNKRYSNYRSFLLNALKRDFKERNGAAKAGKEKYAHI